MRVRELTSFACVLAVAAGFSLVAQAQTKWDMPTPYSETEFHTLNVKRFLDEVKRATGGQLDISLHANGSLIKHPDMLRAVSTGQVNIAEFLLGQFGNEDPVFAADNLPFVAAGWDSAWKFYQAQITSSATGTSTKAWEFVRNYYVTNAFHPKNVVVVNERAFQRLPEASRKALIAAGSEAETRGWEFGKQREQAANKELAANGVTLHEPDAAMKAAYRKVGDTMLAEWLKSAGADGDAIIKSYRAK